MTKDNLDFALIQSNMYPDRIEDNLCHYKQMITSLNRPVDIIILPELFNCGFSSHIAEIAREYYEMSISFLKEMAVQTKAHIVASLGVPINDKVFNRTLWIHNQEIIGYYDKNHLFFGHEKEQFTAGQKQTIISQLGWQFKIVTCYDIRFPLWCRNAFDGQHCLYDILVVTANFPASRSETLEILSRVRAIENQSFVVVVNRVGTDGDGNFHAGNSMIIDPQGRILAQATDNEEQIIFATVNKSQLVKARNTFPVFQDWN